MEKKIVYDNGYKMLGSVKNMRNYIQKAIRYNVSQGEEHKELDDMLEEIKEYSDEDIVLIDYDRPMGFGLDVFNKYDEMESV